MSLSGKSDPYVIFHLNGQRVFKSEVVKKTLNPAWNQSFNCLVVSGSDDSGKTVVSLMT